MKRIFAICCCAVFIWGCTSDNDAVEEPETYCCGPDNPPVAVCDGIIWISPCLPK